LALSILGLNVGLLPVTFAVGDQIKTTEFRGTVQEIGSRDDEQ
jgi:hypothetical protein